MFDINLLVGLKKEEALKLIAENELKWRITAEDGMFFVITRDFKSNRINLEIKDDIIISAEIG